MIINPKVAIEQGWIKNVPEHCLQPNAIDFTLDRLFTIDVKQPFILIEGSDGKAIDKKMRSNFELVPDALAKDMHSTPLWLLEEGVYDGMSDMYVDLPEGVAARLIIRSTFNRNGCLLSSGLYDSGFKGNIGFALHIKGQATVGKGTRVGQIIFEKSEDSGIMYAGGYNTDDGKHWSDKDV